MGITFRFLMGLTAPEAVILHYNDDNKDEIKEQIEEYSHYDNWNLVIDKYVHVIVDEGVTSIGYRAFEGCSSLAGIEIPGSVTDIGVCAFMGCDSLTSIIWHDNTYGSADEFIKAFEAGQQY